MSALNRQETDGSSRKLDHVCVRCGQPLEARTPNGGCWRCLVGLAILDDGAKRTVAAPPEDLPLRYGHFEILLGLDGFPLELGRGSMGITYRARDCNLFSTVALKVITHHVAGHSATRARFLHEARLTAQLRHPNVASVFHYGEQEGECYYVMELVEGETLDARVRRSGPLPVTAVLEIGRQIARALLAAEAKGLVHRDLKPSNLMLNTVPGPPGSAEILVKVIDFGLAKALGGSALVLDAQDTHAGFAGTPAFASPEQHRVHRSLTTENLPVIDSRSDFYSLGVTLWNAACGRLPFAGNTLAEIHRQQVNDPLPTGQLTAAGVPPPAVSLLCRLLAADLRDRPQSARELLAELERCQETIRARRWWKPRRRPRLLIPSVCLLAACGWAAFGSSHGWRQAAAPARPAVVGQKASLAVLPFANLSPLADSAFFAVGIHDGITAGLARISALRIVGPNSVRSYLPGPRDLGVARHELGVGYILEGSIGRNGGEVALRMSLFGPSGDQPRWEKWYHCPAASIFSVQSEVCRNVAGQLQAELLPEEGADINQAPTQDLTAYDLYLRASTVTGLVANADELRQRLLQYIPLLEAVVARDPNFAMAYCDLAVAHDELYYYGKSASADERSVDHRTLAEGALQEARRIRPNSGQVHLAQASHFLFLDDNAHAQTEIELARRELPNDANLELFAGIIAQNQSRWGEAVTAFKRAILLEPREATYRYRLATLYRCQREYDEYDETIAGIIAIVPEHAAAVQRLMRSLGPLEKSGDLAPLRAALAPLSDADDPDARLRDVYELVLSLYERDAAAITRRVNAVQPSQLSMSGFLYPKGWYEGWAARLRGDLPGTEAAFAEARSALQEAVVADPANGQPLSTLAVLDALLGHGELAVREARRACELTPPAKFSAAAPVVRCNLAAVYAWTGRSQLAVDTLNQLLDRPAGIALPAQPTIGDLRLNPQWDPLRHDEMFIALLARAAPARTLH